MVRTSVAVALTVALVALAGPAEGARSGTARASFVWAPSNEIVFNSSNGILVVPPDGGKPRLLTKKIGELGLDVSPDGRTLLFGAVSGGYYKLFTIPLAGGVPRDLGLFGTAAVWSPDGKRIAYDSGGGEYIADADGRHAHKIVTVESGSYSAPPTWSPDGRKLAYVRCRPSADCEHGEGFALYVINVDGSNERRLTPENFPQCPNWSRRALLAFYGENTVHVVRKGEFASFHSASSCPIWDPDGRRLAIYDGSGLVVTRYDGTARKRIPVRGAVYDIAWSPDGTKLAFYAGNIPNAHLYVIGTDGDGLRRLR